MAPNTAARLINGIQKKYGRQRRPAKHYRTFPVNSTHCGLGCFSWNTLCCYLHEKNAHNEADNWTSSIPIFQAAHLIKPRRPVVLNLCRSQFGIQRGKPIKATFCFFPPFNLTILRQRGSKGCVSFAALWGSSQWRRNRRYLSNLLADYIQICHKPEQSANVTAKQFSAVSTSSIRTDETSVKETRAKRGRGVSASR